jgi:hypothetical protein
MREDDRWQRPTNMANDASADARANSSTDASASDTGVRMTGAAGEAIPRDALERVLARATELQGSGGDSSETISESRLLEVAREVGIDALHLRQAMAEERARIAFDAPAGGLLLDALGAALVDAQRTVPGSAPDVQARLDAWLPRMEGLGVRRKMAQRTSWEPRRDPVGNALRALGSGGRRMDLARVDQVIATVTPVDANRSVVRFDVELSRVRRGMRTATLVGGVGVNALLFTAIAVPIMVVAAGSPNAGALHALVGAAAVVQTGIGYGIWRAIRTSYQRTVARVQLRLEQLLDELEQGGMQAPPSVMGQVANALLGAASSKRP